MLQLQAIREDKEQIIEALKKRNIKCPSAIEKPVLHWEMKKRRSLQTR